jgi:gamma-glutamylcyclotransferase (GGCT)/AIG2-like uncharacterized protein YtfP
MKNHTELLQVFVYGTLKQGFINHDRYCGGVLSIEPAAILGRLYEHSCGYPVVEVPRELILAEGTSNYMQDMTVLRVCNARMSDARMPPPQPLRPYGYWVSVSGELMTFDDPASRLPALDELEGFYPGEPTLYRRVLVATQSNRSILLPAWTYVLGTSDEELRLLNASAWSLDREPVCQDGSDSPFSPNF